MNHLERGRDALRRGAWREARDAYTEAVRFEPSAEALEGLGWALYWLDDMDESLAARERAYRAYLERGDRSAAARVAVGLAVDSYDVRGAAVTSGWLERARRHLRGTAESLSNGWVAFYEGHLARMLGDLARAKRLATKAARLAQRFHDSQLELLAEALEGLILVNEGDVDDGMRRVDEATAAAMAGEMSDLDAVAQTCCILLYACERVRDYKRAAEWRERINRFCAEWQIGPLFAVCATQHAAMLIGSGRWKEAEEQLSGALARLEKSRPLLLPDGLVQLAELRRRQGRLDEALALFQRVEGRSESLAGRAAIALERGDAVTALDLAERLLARNSGEKWIERATALEIVVRAALAGDVVRARNALDQLEAIAARVTVPPLRAIAAVARGHLAMASREHHAARTAFAEAVELFDAAQAPYEAANARRALATALEALGRTRAAEEEAEGARRVLKSLGAAPPERGGILTKREAEVLHLIAGGLGDKQLAVRLSLSEHTVHRHVANILRKLGVTSRTAAVAQAMRSGLM